MLRDKLFVEFPLAKTIREAILFMEAGGSAWQECSDDFPDCMGFDTVDDLKENFPEDTWDWDADEQRLFIHLVPEGEENSKAKPFEVGETVWATETIFPTNDIFVPKGESVEITEVSEDGSRIRLKFRSHEWCDQWWDMQKFCRCVLARDIVKKTVYILADIDENNITPDLDRVYEELSFLKEECDDVIWSDEHEDFEAELEKLGLLSNYSGSNWDIEGINKLNGHLRYGVVESKLVTMTEYGI